MRVKNGEAGPMTFEEMIIPVVVNVKVQVPSRYFTRTSGHTEVYSKAKKLEMAKRWARSVLSWSINLHPPLPEGRIMANPTTNCNLVSVLEAKVKKIHEA